MINREIYQKDPTQTALLNNGVAKIGELSSPEEIKTLHFELESFVCDGEYERGLQRILQSFLAQLSQTEQKAAWISGFFGSGKSHLAKMLCYLWRITNLRPMAPWPAVSRICPAKSATCSWNWARSAIASAGFVPSRARSAAVRWTTRAWRCCNSCSARSACRNITPLPKSFSGCVKKGGKTK